MFSSRYRDRLGKPVPFRLENVWRGRDGLEKMRGNLHKWRGSLAGAVAGAMAPQGRRSFSAFQGVPVEEISRLVERIDGLLAAATPQLVCRCPHLYCPYCEGKRWLNAADVRRMSSQERLPELSESLARRLSSGVSRLPVEPTLSSRTLRLLWLLEGPPESNSLDADPETGCSSTEQSASTTTS